MSKLKLIFITGVFLSALIGLRFLWLTIYSTPDHPYAVQGVLDLRNFDIENNRTIPLDGEWEFYPNQFIDPNSVPDNASQSHKTTIQVPGNWSEYVSTTDNKPFGYGSYRLRILAGNHTELPYGILVQDIQASSELFINGKLLARFGQPAELADQYVPRNTSYSVSFETDLEEIEIIVRVANFDNPQKGGITNSIRFGNQASADNERLYSVGFQLVTFVVLLLHGIYAGIIYFFNRRQKALIFFLLLITCAAFNIAIDDDRMLLIWLPINYTWASKIAFISYMGTAVFMLKLTKSLFPENEKGKAFRWYFLLSGIYTLFVLVSPLQYILVTRFVFSGILLFSTLMVPFIIIKLVLKKHSDAIFLLLAATSITSSILWGMMKTRGWIDITFYPFDIFIAFLVFAAYWFQKYSSNAEQTARLAERLQLTDKLKDDFLANTSHELRTPLHGIINIAQTVLDSERTSLSQKNSEDLELLITVGNRMSFILNELLDLTQLKENRISLHLSHLHIQTVVNGVLDMVAFMTENKPVRLVMKIPASFPSVVADEQRLIQIFFNLIHNAIKYTNEGTITIFASIEKEKAYIHISDTGIGMDKETQLRIFRAYEQGDSSITAISGGIGLGLSICQQLVQLHGGTLTVNSILGQGSVFTFTLPLSEDSEVIKNEPNAVALSVQSILTTPFASALEVPLSVTEAPQATGRSKILAVDDDPFNLKILCNILTEDQYEIVTALSGKEAIAKLDEQPWDLVISDVMMPHMSGYELSQIIRKRFSISELPILLLTARSRSEDIYSGFLSGANDYVTKPVDAMELKYRVQALTALKQSISERLRMEAAYLQAQIQPHFLFNTLNAITALSDINVNKMYDLIEAFSSYLRISFDYWNSEQLVPLEYELNLVRSYLYIEKERFEDRLNVTWDLSDDIELELPPLAIQPLVENACRHGILTRSKGGTIHIHISNHPEYTQISIEDDGVGMDEDKILQLLETPPDRTRGIGLRNTDRRLKQMYGQGLQIQSKVNEGTTVSFIIPKQKM